jgi:ABC-2 type transport system permease protein
VSHPRTLVVLVFTFFMYSAPVTGDRPNGLPVTGLGEGAGLILELFAVGYVVFHLAVQLLRYDLVEYTK